VNDVVDRCAVPTHFSTTLSHVHTSLVVMNKHFVTSPGCDVNLPDADGSTPLLIACSHGNEAIVDALLRHPKIDVDRGTLQVPLHSAASVGSRAIVERLIDAGCDVNKVRIKFIAYSSPLDVVTDDRYKPFNKFNVTECHFENSELL